MLVTDISEYKKGRYRILLDNGTLWILYAKEVHSCGLKQGIAVPEELYHKIQVEILGKRAIKRAMHLLERTDQTEKGLRDKLLRGEYPQRAIEDAIAYVKKFHYLDDCRYTENYIRAYQSSRSRKRITMDLLSKGVSKTVIEQVIDGEYEADEQQMIIRLLEKRGYHSQQADSCEQRKVYAFLMRKGFRSEDVLRAMKCSDYLT